MTCTIIFAQHDFLGYRKWSKKAWTFSLWFVSLTVYKGDLIEDYSLVKELVEGTTTIISIKEVE